MERPSEQSIKPKYCEACGAALIEEELDTYDRYTGEKNIRYVCPRYEKEEERLERQRQKENKRSAWEEFWGDKYFNPFKYFNPHTRCT